MNIAIFLSCPRPIHTRQQAFVDQLSDYLNLRGFVPRTLGITDYDMDAPLKAVRRLMIESNGLITLALRRALVIDGARGHGTDIPGAEATPLHDKWLTSPWAHIEPAMAYQLGLPILVLREKGVIDDGILDRGVAGLYMPEIDLDQPIDSYFRSREWVELIGKWEGYVRSVVEQKGNPPKLY